MSTRSAGNTAPAAAQQQQQIALRQSLRSPGGADHSRQPHPHLHPSVRARAALRTHGHDLEEVGARQDVLQDEVAVAARHRGALALVQHHLHLRRRHRQLCPARWSERAARSASPARSGSLASLVRSSAGEGGRRTCEADRALDGVALHHRHLRAALPAGRLQHLRGARGGLLRHHQQRHQQRQQRGEARAHLPLRGRRRRRRPRPQHQHHRHRHRHRPLPRPGRVALWLWSAPHTARGALCTRARAGAAVVRWPPPAARPAREHPSV
eukprot:scaffold1988_cov270-Prasinococcus_capsulatus_cf.AAC.1